MISPSTKTSKTRYGKMDHFSTDTIIGRSLDLYGEWAQIEINLLSLLIGPGDYVIDGGAFIGTHTLAFGEMVGGGGRVFAFEPNPVSYQVLQHNIAANRLTNVTVTNAGLSDRTGGIALNQAGFGSVNPGEFYIGESAERPQASGEQPEVDLTTIDKLSLDKCDFIKLDIEGSEYAAIVGAKKTIQQFSPRIFTECNNLHDGWRVVEQLASLGYAAYFVVTPAYNPDNFLENTENVFDLAREAGVLFLPKGDRLPDGFAGYSGKITSIDDLALAMLFKPQYKPEVLNQTTAAHVFGTEFWLNEVELKNEIEDHQKQLDEEAEKLENFKRLIREHQQSRGQKFLKIISKLNLMKNGTLKFFLSPNFWVKLALATYKPQFRQDVRRYYRIYKYLFLAEWYLDRYEDLEFLHVDPLYHFLERGWKEGRKPNPLFDPNWYLEQNPDVQRSNRNPLVHYGMTGWQEGRKPHILFDPKWYLDQNPDVFAAKLEPISHYLTVGYKEGRPPTFWFDQEEYLGEHPELIGLGKIPFVHFIENCEDAIGFYNENVRGEQVSNALAQSLTGEEFLEIGYVQRQPKQTLDLKSLSQKLAESLAFEETHIAISHDNYLQVTGGVQNCVADQQSAFMEGGVNFIHLYPFNSRPTTLDTGNNFYIGINCNGNHLGAAESSVVLESFARLTSETIFRKLILHHTMGFDLHWLTELQTRLPPEIQTYFWLHDYFSICPSYNLLRNKIEFCNAPGIESNSCMICVYGNSRRKQLDQFKAFFKKRPPVVISPSRFTLDFWKENSDLAFSDLMVQPHGELVHGEKEFTQFDFSSPIKVAFLGYPARHKGWEVFIQLAAKLKDDPRFEFYHFGNRDAEIDLPIHFIEVNVTPDNRNAMIDALVDNDIDAAFLWAIWPETYSFTLFESLSAGCYVLTNQVSGNIQAVVRDQGCGQVFEDKEALFKAFRSGELEGAVRAYFANGKIRMPYRIRTSFEG